MIFGGKMKTIASSSFMLILMSFSLALPQRSLASEEVKSAVHKVQAEMRKSDFHKSEATKTPAAKKTAEAVKALSGSEANEQEIYKLAADILGNMENMSPAEMEEHMKKAAKNPEEFAKNWTPEQKAKLKEISARIPATGNASGGQQHP